MKIAKRNRFFGEHGNLYTPADKALLVFMTVVLVLFFVAIIYPLIYAVISSFTKGLLPLTLIPGRVTFAGYEACFNYAFIWRGFLNSVIYTLLGTAIALFTTICCAYPLSNKLKLGGFATGLCMFTMYFDGGLIPTFLWMKQIHLYNTMWVIILPGALSVYNMIVMRTYFASQIPAELKDAAELDGAGELTYLLRVVLPLSGAVIAVIALYYASGLWGSYFNAMIYLQDRSMMPLANVLRTILQESESYGAESFDTLTAELQEERREVMKYCVIVVSTVPMMVVYPFIQRYFVKGVMIGAVKG